MVNTNKDLKIGIEAIAFDIPEHYLDMAELADARGVEPSKYTQGIGQKQMSVASPCEDTVVQALRGSQPCPSTHVGSPVQLCINSSSVGAPGPSYLASPPAPPHTWTLTCPRCMLPSSCSYSHRV